METRGAQEIQRDKGLGHQAIPQVQWEILIEAAEARGEMIFESADGAFSSIASVFVRRNKLVSDLFGGHECLEGAGALFVKTL